MTPALAKAVAEMFADMNADVDVPALLRRLAAARDPSTKLTAVIAALTQAANPASESTIARIVNGGGTSLVVEIMSSRSRSAKVAEWGCAALQAFAHGDAAIADAVADAGAAVAAVASLDTYGASDEDVAMAGCAALCHICGGSQRATAAVVSAGGPRAVTATLQAHFASRSSGSVVRNSVNFFHWLCRPENRATTTAAVTACIAAGCVPVLLAVIRLRKAEPFVQSTVPSVLRYFSITSAANGEAVRAAGGAEYCVS